MITKAKCLQLMDQVQKTHQPLLITKRGIPVAQLVPIEESTLDLFATLKGSVNIHADIISPIGEKWEANNG